MGGKIVAWAIIFVATYGAAALGGFFGPDEWYTKLPKPTWTPPGWLFGPVWTFLYTAMAVAAGLVQSRTGWRHPALALYAVQLVLNALWSPLFFGLHRPDLALGDIVVLWLAIVATAVAFGRIIPVAGLLFVPYVAWVTFAAVLNAAIWEMWRRSVS